MENIINLILKFLNFLDEFQIDILIIFIFFILIFFQIYHNIRLKKSEERKKIEESKKTKAIRDLILNGRVQRMETEIEAISEKILKYIKKLESLSPPLVNENEAKNLPIQQNKYLVDNVEIYLLDYILIKNELFVFEREHETYYKNKQSLADTYVLDCLRFTSSILKLLNENFNYSDQKNTVVDIPLSKIRELLLFADQNLSEQHQSEFLKIKEILNKYKSNESIDSIFPH
jgi:hypothetical protein